MRRILVLFAFVMALGIASKAGALLGYETEIIFPRDFATIRRCFDESRDKLILDASAAPTAASRHVIRMQRSEPPGERGWPDYALRVSDQNGRTVIRGEPFIYRRLPLSQWATNVWLEAEIGTLDEHHTRLSWRGASHLWNQYALDAIVECAMGRIPGFAGMDSQP